MMRFARVGQPIYRPHYSSVRYIIYLLVAVLLLVACAEPIIGPTAVADPALTQAQWSLGAEVTRAGNTLVGAYDTLDDQDDARVPAEARGLAHAARIAALFVLCRLAVAVAPADELEMAKQISEKLWQSLNVKPAPAKPTPPQRRPQASDVLHIDIGTAIE